MTDEEIRAAALNAAAIFLQRQSETISYPNLWGTVADFERYIRDGRNHPTES